MDQRKKHVKERALAALLHLAKEKDLTKITVSEVIDISGIARASFYRHFQSIEDVLRYGLDYLQVLFWDEAPKPKSFPDLTLLTYTFHFYQDYHFIISLFKRANLTDCSLHAISHFMTERLKASSNTYHAYFYAGALYNLILAWIDNGMKENAEEMAQLYLKMIKGQEN